MDSAQAGGRGRTDAICKVDAHQDKDGRSTRGQQGQESAQASRVASVAAARAAEYGALLARAYAYVTRRA